MVDFSFGGADCGEVDVIRLRVRIRTRILTCFWIVARLMWCDISQSYELREALFVNAVDEDFPQEVADYKKGFADVANSEVMSYYDIRIRIPIRI